MGTKSLLPAAGQAAGSGGVVAGPYPSGGRLAPPAGLTAARRTLRAVPHIHIDFVTSLAEQYFGDSSEARASTFRERPGVDGRNDDLF